MVGEAVAFPGHPCGSPSLVLATLLAAPTTPATPRKPGAPRARDRRRAGGPGLRRRHDRGVAAGGQTVASEAAWSAATDVTPEHTGAAGGRREDRRRPYSGSEADHREDQGLPGPRETAATTLTARQLRTPAAGRRQEPRDHPRGGGQAHRGRDPAVEPARRVQLLPAAGWRPLRAAGLRQRSGRAPAQIPQPGRAGAGVAGLEGDWRSAQAWPGPAAGAAQPGGQGVGYSSFFALQVADYGMTVPEMMALLDATLATTRPLFDGLHCWAKNTLAARYQKPVPQADPGPLDPQPLGPVLARPGRRRRPRSPCSRPSRRVHHRSGRELLRFAGFPAPAGVVLAEVGPVPRPAAARKKNAHASAWHIDRDRDVRSLMSVEPDSRWFSTAHHELGHIYYYISYARPQVPYPLRAGPTAPSTRRSAT